MVSSVPYIPESAPFTAEQRAWLNGFLAGWLAQGGPVTATGTAPAPAPATPAEPLPILFGSQTGTAEGVARRLAREAKARGFNPQVLPLDEYEKVPLAQGGNVLVVSSTWGDGDPPDNAVRFWNWLNSEGAPRLEKLRYAVLGLGDTQYADFCGASKKFDARMEALGATRLVPRGECDVDYEEPARQWMDGLWARLMPGPAGKNGHIRVNGHDHGPVPTAATEGYGRKRPFPARLLRNQSLNRPGSAKDVRHYEISLEGSGLTYAVGDALGVMPQNDSGLVDDVVVRTGGNGDEMVAVDNRTLPWREALLRQLDLGKPTRKLLAHVARVAPEMLPVRILEPGGEGELKAWLKGRDVLDVLQGLPQALAPAELAGWLARLNPRLYSISSSPKAHPNEVHLTVNTVRYESHGRRRLGVASGYLAERVPPGGEVGVFVQPSHGFKLPPSGDTPIIMIGPGTGVAPFRAFLEERQATGTRGRHWLFFGDQCRATDFLYEDQILAWLKEGHLTRLDLAFSRDQADKVYVQHRMREQARELWSWLEDGAHFYVCGDALRMARDVDAALHAVVETAGQRSREEAIAYVHRLKSDKRYQRDVY